MARINLLPWREELRKQRQKNFFISLGVAAAITVGVMLIVQTYFAGLIGTQSDRNAFLEKEIKVLDEQIKEIQAMEKTKERLEARINIITELQESRPQIVNMFAAVVKTLTDGIYLTSLQQQGTAVTLEGVAESNTRVSGYMRSLNESNWMRDPDLQVIKRADRQARTRQFTLKVTQADKKKEAEQKQKEQDGISPGKHVKTAGVTR